MAATSLRCHESHLNRNMNWKRSFVKFCILALLSLVESLPFSQNSNLQQPKPLESEVCVYDDIIYPAGQNFTSSNPCETCICEPPKYTCTVKNCLLRVGCKALHLANECCPQYVCDCERNGKKYANGEKVDEANPCKVCYCTGGEIKCSLVECYTRPDCEPIYVPGRCCPKYDHCPPLGRTRKKKPTTEGTDEPEIAETIRNDVTSGLQYSSASVQMVSVPTLEIYEVYPTDGNVFLKSEPESRESSAETVLDVTSSSLSYEPATEETENVSETSTVVETSTMMSWKETEASSSAELDT